jgi:hypothetical protein
MERERTFSADTQDRIAAFVESVLRKYGVVRTVDLHPQPGGVRIVITAGRGLLPQDGPQKARLFVSCCAACQSADVGTFCKDPAVQVLRQASARIGDQYLSLVVYQQSRTPA